METCADIVRTSDYDRYLTVLYAREEDRPHLFALYALNVELARIPTIVSEPMLGEIRFAWWREAIEDIAQGRVRQHPVIEALSETLTQKDLPQPLFETMIEARIKDIYTPSPANIQDLEHYSIDTAGALMALALHCVGEEREELCRHAGAANALIGALRGLAFQADLKHFPLPEGEIDPAQIYKGEITADVQVMAEKIVGRARDCLDLAKRASKPLSRRAMPVAMPLVFLEQDLKRLAKRDFTKKEEPATPSALARHWLLFRAAVLGRL